MKGLNDLTGKVALISGGARGIGARTAEVFCAQGAAVAVTDVLDREGKELVESLSSKGAKVLYARLDVTSEADWDAAVARTVKELGGFDILINNAGVEKATFLVDTSLADFRRHMSVNVEGVFLGTRAAFRAMRPGGAAGNGGSIVNISSIAGFIGFPGFSAYGASKGAVRIFSRHAAVEAGRLGLNVRVNSIHPGVVDTEMGQDVFRKGVELGMMKTIDEAREVMRSMHPIGFMGSTDDIAALMTFLASDASRWITGAEIAVDGGFTAQ